MRIFVVENHPDTLKYLRMYLESMGHAVTTACTMQEALAASPTEDCDVLLSDLGLPDGDGWQLLKQVRFPKPVYAVAISGFASQRDIERSKAAGFRRHIVKPFGGEDLREALEEATREIEAGFPQTREQATLQPTREKPVDQKAASLTARQIADRLHHSTCQNLLAAQLLLRVVQGQLPEDGAEVRQLVAKALGCLDEAGAELSAMMTDLRMLSNKDSESEEPPITKSSGFR